TLEALPHVSLQTGQLEVRVKAVGLNFRDVLNAMDLYPGEMANLLGSDCSGIVSAIGPIVTTYQIGDEVMGFAEGSIATQAVSRVEWLVKKPTTWSFTEAATVPVVFSTAYYSLIELAQIKSENKVLIHAAACGIGLAAIQMTKYQEA